MAGAYRPRLLVHDDVFRRLCRARDLVRDRYADDLTLDELAQAACFSRDHFLRLYRAVFQRTPHQDLVEVRLDRAKAMLRRAGASVTDVCFDVGFSSLGSFSSLFARRVGASPQRFHRAMVTLAQVPDRLQRVSIPGCFLARYVDFGEAPRRAVGVEGWA